MVMLLRTFGDLWVSGPKSSAKEEVFDLHMMHISSEDLAVVKLYFHVNFIYMTKKKLYEDMWYICFNLKIPFFIAAINFNLK